MSFKQIKELRQAGKLNEALEFANQALEKDPGNIWNKRAAAWVYYDFMKKYAHSDSFEEFRENLIKIKELQLPEDEKILFDNCAWQIGSLVFNIKKSDQVDYGKINALFEIIKDLHFTKPSEAYSFLFKSFHKDYQAWANYLTFADWWNLENFRTEDFLAEMFKDRKIMPVAEQAYIAYSKKLLEGEAMGPYGQQRKQDQDKIKSFIPKLDALISRHPDYLYPAYYKARLLLALGSDENVLSAFLPFAKQKRNDFWVWGLMADIYSKDKDIRFACYCKALSLNTPEDFLIKQRQTFAEMLIEKKMYDEAITELEKVIVTRQNNAWPVTGQILKWTEQEWYKSATLKKDNRVLYSNHLKIAEDLLFQDIREEMVVVEFVNENKKMLNFVKDKETFGYFKYSGHLENPNVGDVLKVRFNGASQDGYYRIFSAKTHHGSFTSETIREFQGGVRIKLPNSFGFVDDIFIDSDMITNKHLKPDQLVRGKAIISYNKKKGTWGWKALTLEKITI